MSAELRTLCFPFFGPLFNPTVRDNDMIDQLRRLRMACWNGIHWADIVLVFAVCLFPLISAYKIWSNADGLLKYLCGIVLLGMVARGGAREEISKITAGFRTPLGLVASAALIYAVLSSLWSPNVAYSLHQAAEKTVAIGAAIIVCTRLLIISNQQMQQAFGLVTIVGLLLLFVDEVTGFPVIHLLHNNLSIQGLHARANPNVMTLTMLAWLAIGTFVLEKNRMGAWTVWLLAGAAMAISSSEASQFGYVAGSLVLALASWSVPLAVWAGVVGCLGALLLAPFVATGAAFAINVLPAQWLASASVFHRIEIWSLRAGSIEQSPFFGSGFQSIGKPHPHNAALQIWIEFGALGALLAAVLIVLTGLALLRSTSPRNAFVLACAVSLFANAYVSFGMWESQWLGIVLLVSIVAISGLSTGEGREQA
jgi:exopolysaccharide production protein ExoQ